MKAAILKEYGSPENFKIVDVPSPAIKEGQILVGNKASSVNPIDTLVREGKLKIFTGLFGDPVLGADFCGTVIRSKSTLYKEGEEVFGFKSALSGGSYAEEVVVDEENAAPKPLGISDAEAASLPLVGCTALQGLLYEGKLHEGDHVLITGCTGGVGSVAVQIAKAKGAIVTGVCSGSHNDFAKALGCDQIIDYRSESIPENHEYDLFFDAAGRYTYSDVKNTMKKSALFVSTRGKMNSLGGILETAADLVKKKTKILRVNSNTKDLIKLRNLVEKKWLYPYVSKTFPFEKLGDAHKMMERGGFTGKIAVQIS